jgi:hypothetical protein
MTDAHKLMIAGRTDEEAHPAHCHIIVGLLPRLDRFKVVRTINPSGPNTEDVEDDSMVVRKVAFEFCCCCSKCKYIVQGSGDGSITCIQKTPQLACSSHLAPEHSRSQRRRHRSRHRRAEEEQNGVHIILGITITDRPLLTSASLLHYHHHQP